MNQNDGRNVRAQTGVFPWFIYFVVSKLRIGLGPMLICSTSIYTNLLFSGLHRISYLRMPLPWKHRKNSCGRLVQLALRVSNVRLENLRHNKMSLRQPRYKSIGKWCCWTWLVTIKDRGFSQSGNKLMPKAETSCYRIKSAVLWSRTPLSTFTYTSTFQVFVLGTAPAMKTCFVIKSYSGFEQDGIRLL